LNIVDSSAWLSYFAGDSNAEYFAEPIENTTELMVPSITLIWTQDNDFESLDRVNYFTKLDGK
jgi:hypothetical protein